MALASACGYKPMRSRMAVEEQEMEGVFNGGENFVDNVNILKQILSLNKSRLA